MDREAWQVTFHGVARFGHDLVTKPSHGFSSSHVWMWELDYKQSWAPKNWCFWTMVLEKDLESPLDCKEIQPVHPKGDQSWVFIGRTDAEAETPILWLPDGKNQLIGKDPDAGKDWRHEEKGMTENEMFGWQQTLWTWVWARSGRWWRTGKPGVLQSMGSQRVRCDLRTEQQTKDKCKVLKCLLTDCLLIARAKIMVMQWRNQTSK